MLSKRDRPFNHSRSDERRADHLNSEPYHRSRPSMHSPNIYSLIAENSLLVADSSSSSTTSPPFANNAIATSKSVDFRQAQVQMGQSASSNEGSSNGDLRDCYDMARTQTPLNSVRKYQVPLVLLYIIERSLQRLPLPRRPVMGGKTSIPMPVSARATKPLSREKASTSSTLSVHLNDDDECF